MSIGAQISSIAQELRVHLFSKYRVLNSVRLEPQMGILAYGSGFIGRSGPLAATLSRKSSVFAKIDPVTEELERNSKRICIQVLSSERV